MKSERKMSNLRRQVMEIEVKEGKLRHRKEQILEELMLMEKSADTEEKAQRDCSVSSVDWSAEGLKKEVEANGLNVVDNYSWAQAVAYCVTNDWNVEATELFKLVGAFEGVPLDKAVGMVADEAPDKLKLRPPEGKFFNQGSFVFGHPKILALQ